MAFIFDSFPGARVGECFSHMPAWGKVGRICSCRSELPGNLSERTQVVGLFNISKQTRVHISDAVVCLQKRLDMVEALDVFDMRDEHLAPEASGGA